MDQLLKMSCIPLITLTLISCSLKKERKIRSVQTHPKFETITQETISEISEYEARDHLRKRIAQYPDSLRHEYPFDPALTQSALVKLRTDNRDSLDYFIAWLFTKKYRYHLECCHQGYELRSLQEYVHPRMELDSVADPWLFEFLLTSTAAGKGKPNLDRLLKRPYEFIHSGLIMAWLEKRSDLIRDEVAEEVVQIKALEKDIKRGVFWK